VRYKQGTSDQSSLSIMRKRGPGPFYVVSPMRGQTQEERCKEQFLSPRA
jgi:hypothetical protein